MPCLEDLRITPKWWLPMAVMDRFTRGEQGSRKGMIEVGWARLPHAPRPFLALINSALCLCEIAWWCK